METMEASRSCRRCLRGRRKAHTPEEMAAILRRSWLRLRVSVRDPTRVPTWDAVVLTAASPEQAELYEWQLSRARRLGRVAAGVAVLVVPDPDGARIGSGAATLNAVAAVAKHLFHAQVVVDGKTEALKTDASTGDGFPTDLVMDFMADKRILLLHAGGDSKRVPWANPMGKVFLPLPFLANDDPDGSVPLLFDHILAISSGARQAFDNQGGLFIMTGDVLPCFDSSKMLLPDDASCVVTVPSTLDIAANHGVIVTSKDGTIEENYSLSLVENLLQKPTTKELLEKNAILDDGKALLDTGLIAVKGKAWVELVGLACSSINLMIKELMTTKQEMSLYEDLVAAWVSSKHDWLKTRPLGKELVSALGRHKMFSFCSYDFTFLHFGTSAEVLDHLVGSNLGMVGRRHLCLIPETTACDIAATAILLSSKISPGVSIGEDSLVYDSSMSGRIQIGSQSVVVGVSIHSIHDGYQQSANSAPFILPDHHCLWEVPLVNSMGRILVYSGLHDNPKVSVEKGGTFCGQPWKRVLDNLGIQEGDLWSSVGDGKCLWNAKIYPVLPSEEMLKIGMWLMGSAYDLSGEYILLWRTSQRISLEELHRSIDYPQLCADSSRHQADLAAGIVKACVTYGSLGRNLFQLCDEIVHKDKSGIEFCREMLSFFADTGYYFPQIIPASRVFQLKLDLLRVTGDHPASYMVEQKVWAAVASETAAAVNVGSEDHVHPSSNSSGTPNVKGTSEGSTGTVKKVIVELPVRVDFVGGWSDTPPWSLERSGSVLNMAVKLNGAFPVGVMIQTMQCLGVLIEDDSGGQVHIDDPTSICAPFDNDDKFRLVKSALLVTGITRHKMLTQCGLLVRTWANVPRGSGLGTSSILAAAVVKGILQVMEEDDGNDVVARTVLVLEQVMGTGGGWQDQIGGLYPGIKCTQSFPEQPLRLQVIPLLASKSLLQELEQRLLIVFTGQVRIANQVLQKVVTRYLRRDRILISSIKRLAALARSGREALMAGDVDELGGIMLEAWGLHQELDPFCSNRLVDALFAFAHPYCCGYKLVGAGGGGFALLLAKGATHAEQLQQALRNSPKFDVQVYDWSISL